MLVHIFYVYYYYGSFMRSRVESKAEARWRRERWRMRKGKKSEYYAYVKEVAEEGEEEEISLF